MNLNTFARPLAGLAVVASLALAGCGNGEKRIPVFKTAGKITFRNQPIEGAFVVLHPKGNVAPDAPRPRASVLSDGTFEATTFEAGDGAPPGEYVVTVEWQRIAKVGGEFVRTRNLLPPKYASPATSDIVVQVAEGQNELSPIVLR